VRRAVRLLLALVVALAAIVAVTPLRRTLPVAYRLATARPPEHETVPVKDAPARAVSDSWGAARTGGRHHEGIDIPAPRGQPVVSATEGIVVRVGTNRLGGQVVDILGPGLETHYYAHLDRYGDVKPGDVVEPGDVIGYVGNTGDANGTPFHLHYGIYSWNGTATNPYPRLVAAK